MAVSLLIMRRMLHFIAVSLHGNCLLEVGAVRPGHVSGAKLDAPVPAGSGWSMRMEEPEKTQSTMQLRSLQSQTFGAVSGPMLATLQRLLDFEKCSKERIYQTLSHADTNNFSGWLNNLPQSLHDAYIVRKDGEGTAVLMVGHVRTGIREDNVKSIRANVVEAIQAYTSYQSVHVFAVLEFETGGYQDWQYWMYPKQMGAKQPSERIPKKNVEDMLKGYSARFDLLEGSSTEIPEVSKADCS